jgi:ABC-2 type transport system ATP-binding protein
LATDGDPGFAIRRPAGRPSCSGSPGAGHGHARGFRGFRGQAQREVPGSHIQLRFTDVVDLDTAARILPGSTRDDEALILRVPGDGGTKSVRDLLDRLGEHSIEAEDVSVHTPDLDDVFLALTGHASTEETAR